MNIIASKSKDTDDDSPASPVKKDLFTRSKNGDIVVYDAGCTMLALINNDEEETEVVDEYVTWDQQNVDIFRKATGGSG